MNGRASLLYWDTSNIVQPKQLFRSTLCRVLNSRTLHINCCYYCCRLLYMLQEMNVESSRSHLIVGIMVESRNMTNGSVSTGKLSLVDLAGSERAAKTGAKDHQLKVIACFMFWLSLYWKYKIFPITSSPTLCRKQTQSTNLWAPWVMLSQLCLQNFPMCHTEIASWHR